MKKPYKKYDKKLNTRRKKRKQNKRTRRIRGGNWFNWLGLPDSSIGEKCEKCEGSYEINSPKELTSIGGNKTYQLCTPNIKYIYISPINVIINDGDTMQKPKFKIEGKELAIKYPATKLGWFNSQVKNDYYVSIFIKCCNTWFMQLQFDISKKSPIPSESIYKIDSSYIHFNNNDINFSPNSYDMNHNNTEIILNPNCATFIKSDSTEFRNIEPFMNREQFKRFVAIEGRNTIVHGILKAFF